MVQFDEDEVWRINRARMARELHKLPSEIDDMPYLDMLDLIAVGNADSETAKRQAPKRAAAVRGRRK